VADDRHQINSLLLVGSMGPRIHLIPFLTRMSSHLLFSIYPSSIRPQSSSLSDLALHERSSPPFAPP
jgi:hypothetical protein